MSQAYCVRCNRRRKKGKWKTVELVNERIKTVTTKGSPRRFLYGECPKCGSTVTKILGK